MVILSQRVTKGCCKFYLLFDTQSIIVIYHGCFMLNAGTELSPHDREVNADVTKMNRAIEDAFYQALQYAQQQGEISDSCNLQEISRFLLCLYQGIFTVSKGEQDLRTAQSSIRFTKQLLQQL